MQFAAPAARESTYVALFRHVFGQPAPHDAESQTADNRDGPLKDLVPQRVLRKHDALHDTVNRHGCRIVDPGHRDDQRRDALEVSSLGKFIVRIFRVHGDQSHVSRRIIIVPVSGRNGHRIPIVISTRYRFITNCIMHNYVRKQSRNTVHLPIFVSNANVFGTKWPQLRLPLFSQSRI